MRSGHDFSRQHHASRLYPPSSGSFVAMNSLAATTAVGRACVRTPDEGHGALLRHLGPVGRAHLAQ